MNPRTNEEINQKMTFLQGEVKITLSELESIIANARWLTTLVLAEIGGLAAYRDLGDKKSLSLFVVIIILILSFSLLFFLITIITSRNIKKSVEHLRMDFSGKMRKILNDDELNAKMMLERSVTILEEAVSALENKTNTVLLFEKLAIIMLIAASVLSAIYLFSSELATFFCG